MFRYLMWTLLFFVRAHSNSWVVVLKQDIDLHEHIQRVLSLVSADLGLKHFSLDEQDGLFLNGYSIALPPEILDLLQSLLGSEIDYVEPDVICKTSQTSVQKNPPNWALARLNQQKLPLSNEFKYPASAGTNVSIYVVDTGVDPLNSEFIVSGCKSRVIQGYTAFDNNFADENGHGTFVASNAAGNRFGVAKNATIVEVRVLDANGEGQLSDVVRGLQWTQANITALGLQNGGAVINLSFGTSRSRTIDRAVSALTNAGVPVVTAAGNEKSSACNTSPATVSDAITVGATTRQDRFASFSNTGSCIDLLAPGEEVSGAGQIKESSANSDEVSECSISSKSSTSSGTSFSAPLVAGAVALILADNSTRPKSSGSRFTNDVTSALLKQSTNGVISGIPRFSRTPNVLLRVPQ